MGVREKCSQPRCRGSGGVGYGGLGAEEVDREPTTFGQVRPLLYAAQKSFQQTQPMLRMFGNKENAQMPRLFRLTLHIKRGVNQEMPSNLVGAYVPVFVAG